MSKQGTDNKTAFLGMPFGTASHRLRKIVLFSLLKKHNENICFQCKKEIETVEELSMEHKKPWLNESIDLFWDMDNIAFSHLHCNCSNRRYTGEPRKLVHGTFSSYSNLGCRCDECKSANTQHTQKYRNKK